MIICAKNKNKLGKEDRKYGRKVGVVSWDRVAGIMITGMS